MSHYIFEAALREMSDVTLEGPAGLTVQQLLDAPDLIQNTVTIGATSHSTPTPSHHHHHHLSSPSPATTTISMSGGEGVTLDEEDVFQCGRCKRQFSSLDLFMLHKRDHCSGKNRGICTLQIPPGTGADDAGDQGGGYEGEETSLTSQIHVEVQPQQQVPVSGRYGGDSLPSPGTINQHIIVNEAELLPFTIETTQVLPLPGLQTSSFLPVSTTSKTLSSSSCSSSSVSPLLTTTASTVTTALDVGSNLSSPQTLGTIVCEGEIEGEEGTGGVGSREESGEEGRDDVACYNHEFFHAGMAKAAPSKTDPIKLKPKHRCPFCAKEFSKNFDLQQHIRSHTGEKPFQCIVCGRAFTQKSNVKKHMATHRVWPSGSLTSTLPKDPIRRKLTMATPASPVDMVTQMVPIDEGGDNVGTGADSTGSGELREAVYVDDSYVCQFCGEKLKSYVELRTHMKCHAHQKVYKCIQKNCIQKNCEVAFEDLDSFLDHIKGHNQDMQYRCHTCARVFTSLNDLGCHQYEHSVYPHPKKTVGPSYFRCTQCMNKYASAEALDHHLRTSSHHYPCKQCGKVFSSERLLRRHLHVHGTVNLFTCHQCSKQFKSEYSLKLHQLIHTGEKPFECDVCKTAFNRRDKLKRHMLIHDPKKFTCPYRNMGCLREFSRQDKLRLHTLTHAGGRGKRGRGRGTGRNRTTNSTSTSSSSRTDRHQIKTENNPVPDVRCSDCLMSVKPGEEDEHKCLVIKSEVEVDDDIWEDDRTVSGIGGGHITNAVRPAAGRRTRDTSTLSTGRRAGTTTSKRKRGCAGGGIIQSSTNSNIRQNCQEVEQGETNKQTIQTQQETTVEDDVLGVSAPVEGLVETEGDADTQNVEILIIPVSLQVISSGHGDGDEEATLHSEILDGGPSITLDAAAPSLLMGNSAVVPLDTLQPGTIIKTSPDLQVIYSDTPSATTASVLDTSPQDLQAIYSDTVTTTPVVTPAAGGSTGSCSVHLLDGGNTPLGTPPSEHIHSSPLTHDSTLDDTLTPSHLTHLTILPPHT
ncbi:hypothetical protein Pmani_037767 [Petrolisthes manimaculis]|uniref:C2H2-type domain-containing protein n=1 Tax=Petrolisthes manimaculis TaxID=1843537 RepID=A0AAE1NHN0_9EUCA|nr:hypothetical protein Pmani_037767 [Petrolisthes manimaculis]